MNHPSADQLTINSQFAVPVGVNFLPDSEKLNDALKTLILTKEQDPKVKKPYASMHVGDSLFESAFDFFSRPEACVQELKHFCQSTLKTFIEPLVKQPEQLRNVSLHAHTWFHVTRKGGYFGLHNQRHGFVVRRVLCRYGRRKRSSRKWLTAIHQPHVGAQHVF